MINLYNNSLFPNGHIMINLYNDSLFSIWENIHNIIVTLIIILITYHVADNNCSSFFLDRETCSVESVPD